MIKVDVEGAELQVLKSIDLKKVKRWIISVEHHKPKGELELIKKFLEKKKKYKLI